MPLPVSAAKVTSPCTAHAARSDAFLSAALAPCLFMVATNAALAGVQERIVSVLPRKKEDVEALS